MGFSVALFWRGRRKGPWFNVLDCILLSKPHNITCFCISTNLLEIINVFTIANRKASSMAYLEDSVKLCFINEILLSMLYFLWINTIINYRNVSFLYMISYVSKTASPCGKYSIHKASCHSCLVVKLYLILLQLDGL